MTKKTQVQQTDLEIFVQKYGKVKRLAERLNAGEVVQVREIAAILGKQATAEFESRWQDEINFRKNIKDKPHAVLAYEAKLKRGDMLFGRAEKLSATAAGRKRAGKVVQSDAVKNMYYKAEKMYEEALEILAENYAADKSLEMYFDRDLDFAIGSELAPDIGGVPRTKTSRSAYSKNVEYSKTGDRTITPTLAAASKADIKLDLVERALAEMTTTYTALENTLVAVKAAKAEEEVAERAVLKLKLQELRTVKR